MDAEPVIEPLPMRKRTLVPVGANQYRVMSSTGEEKNVEANTAYEAFKLSGVTEAIKIVRLSTINSIIISKSQFTDGKDDSATSLSEIMALEAEEFDQIKMLRNPIISANDLDKIMRGFQEEMSKVPGLQEPPLAASGTEVHNDGFDEIIPASNGAVKPAAKPASEPKEELKTESVATQDIPPAPEKALSAEEVDKLLKSE